MGTADVFLNLSCRLMVWFKRIRVKTIGDPSKISIDGLHPRHLKGKTRGLGLFLIITINSSLYYLGSVGIAHTLTYFAVWLGSIDILSTDRLKTFLLYSGLFSIIELKNANSTSAVNGPLFNNLNTVELTLITSLSFFFYWDFPISNGPKSNTFYVWTNTFDKKQSGTVVGRFFFMLFPNMILGWLLKLGNSVLPLIGIWIFFRLNEF